MTKLVAEARLLLLLMILFLAYIVTCNSLLDKKIFTLILNSEAQYITLQFFLTDFKVKK